MPQCLISCLGEYLRQKCYEIFNPSGKVCFCPSHIVIVVLMHRERYVITAQVTGMLFLQGKESIESISVSLQNKGGKKAGRSAVAVIVGVSRSLP